MDDLNAEIARRQARIAELEAELAFLCGVVRAASYADIDLLWRVQAGHVIPAVICNDTFAWGCADAEDITPATLAVFEQTVKDLSVMVHDAGSALHHAPELYASRVRRMRPQGALYERYWPELAALFDAAGPERDAPSPMGNTPRRAYAGGRKEAK